MLILGWFESRERAGGYRKGGESERAEVLRSWREDVPVCAQAQEQELSPQPDWSLHGTTCPIHALPVPSMHYLSHPCHHSQPGASMGQPVPSTSLQVVCDLLRPATRVRFCIPSTAGWPGGTTCSVTPAASVAQEGKAPCCHRLQSGRSWEAENTKENLWLHLLEKASSRFEMYPACYRTLPHPAGAETKHAPHPGTPLHVVEGFRTKADQQKLKRTEYTLQSRFHVAAAGDNNAF
nr:uncharacterized protein LOC102086107 [Columba livia]